MEEIRHAKEYREDRINAAASFPRILPALFSHYYLDYGLLPTSQMVLTDKRIEIGLLDHTIDLAVVCDWMEGEKLPGSPSSPFRWWR